MRSPVGHHPRLERIELEQGLIAYRCPESGGHWIRAEQYWKWHSTLKDPCTPSRSEPGEENHPVSEYDDVVKLCPDSGTVMTRYRVGHGHSFRIDRSPTGGIWLDGGEWEALKAENLHHTLHLIFGAPWQKAVRDHARDESHRLQLIQRLGPDLHARLESLHQELAHHPERAAALAYLNSPLMAGSLPVQ